MERKEIENKSDEKVPKEDLSEFHKRSLDIDIAFYGAKLKKLKKSEI